MKIIRLAIVLCLVLTVAACSNTSSNSQTEPAGGSSTPSTQPANGGSEPSDKIKITREQYDKVSNGMSYKEVIEIVGGEGEIITETGEKGTDLFGMGVMYGGEGSLGANANFIFIGDKLQSKSQIGLE